MAICSERGTPAIRRASGFFLANYSFYYGYLSPGPNAHREHRWPAAAQVLFFGWELRQQDDGLGSNKRWNLSTQYLQLHTVLMFTCENTCVKQKKYRMIGFLG
jgi:hypothetical protein